MTFIERKLFSDKRTNLTLYEKHLSNLLARNRDSIYWMELFHDKRTNLTVYEKLLVNYIARSRDGIY
jgi:hypothetical protein